MERLYNAMGYLTRLAPRHNGGYDVYAKKSEGTNLVSLFIKCKISSETVGVPILHELLDVVSHNSEKIGVCITTGKITGQADFFIYKNPRLECVDGKLLIKRLNEHLGVQWYLFLDRLVVASQRSHGILKPAL